MDWEALKALVMVASVVALAWTMEFQKVMLTTPLCVARADRLQVGSLVAAPAGVRAAAPSAVAVMIDPDTMNRAAVAWRKARRNLMGHCLPLPDPPGGFGSPT